MTLTKTGPHIIRTTGPGMAWAARAPICKALDNLDPLRAARPDAWRVHRHYFEEQDWGRSAESIARDILDSLHGYRHPKLLAEIAWNEVREVDWPKMLAITALLNASGVRTTGPCWGTGDYDIGSWVTARAYHWGGVDAINVHAYWAERGLTKWNAFRFADLWQPGDPPIIVSECGRDRVKDGDKEVNGGWIGCGWRDAGVSGAQYVAELQEYDRRLSELPYVLGATVYTCGAYPDEPTQTPYDVDELVEMILQFTPGVNPPIQEEEETVPDVTEISDIWYSEYKTNHGGLTPVEWEFRKHELAIDANLPVTQADVDAVSEDVRSGIKQLEMLKARLNSQEGGPEPEPLTTGQQIVAEGRKWIGQLTYCWDGKDPARGCLDCSGYLDVAWKVVTGDPVAGGGGTWWMLDKAIKMDQRIAVPDLQAGDIVFWDIDKMATTPSHVGIATGEGTVLECSLRYDGITETPWEPEWAERFHSAWRIV